MVAANTPIVIGVATASRRGDNPLESPEACELMAEAAREAAARASAPQALRQLDAVCAMASLVGYRNPAGLAAEAVGSPDAHTVRADPGILQQQMFSKVCNAIAAGDMDIALVVSGETSWRTQQARIAGLEAPATDDSGSSPDEEIVPEFVVHEAEIKAGLRSAVSHYSLLENAYRSHHGQTKSQQAAETGVLWARFSEVASGNPEAWNRSAMSTDEIAIPSAKNRTMAFPYTKHHCSQMNVDQAAALIFCSAERAQALGVPKDNWVFPLGAALSNHAVPVVQRADPHASPGFGHIGRRITELCGISPAEADFIDLYSCFPVAVKVQAGELGLSLEQQLTVTGGMAFAGGPFNSYVLHSLCKTVELLREKPEAVGLVTSISGMITKQGIGMFSATPPETPAVFEDATDAVREMAPPLQVHAGDPDSETYTMIYGQHGLARRSPAYRDATVATYTVLYDRVPKSAEGESVDPQGNASVGSASAGSVPTKGIVVAEFTPYESTADGWEDGKPVRQIVSTTDPDVIEQMVADDAPEFCGTAITCSDEGEFTLA